TGHDINHEFQVFQNTDNNSLWISRPSLNDFYNSCLSITILPTIFAKITSISGMYVYKLIFQIIFAFGLVPIYYFIKKLSNEKKALIGSFLFISFPTFLNDMPFLNRQEIAIVFFNLLILTTFIKIPKKTKTILTIIFLTGIMFSHYSTNFIIIGILSMSWFFYKLLTRKLTFKKIANLPLLNLRIIVLAIFLTFLWNVQITRKTSLSKSTLLTTFNKVTN
ncbi:MAG: glycosyltransferase family 39 protein, partial [Candidatus Shapirobacteria bacterium]|nr:glycosyltransferase family 39 protein [Candidatus Shapirobacteria bacterium]